MFIFVISLRRTKTADETLNLWTYPPKKAEGRGTEDKKFRSNTSKAKAKRAAEEELNSRPMIAKQIRVLASFEPPQIVFSKKFLAFRIDASPVQEDFQARGENSLHFPIFLQCFITQTIVNYVRATSNTKCGTPSDHKRFLNRVPIFHNVT